MFTFSLKKIVNTVSKALDTYNKELYSYVDTHAVPYIWAEGGEWPAYSERFFNIFPNLQSALAVTVNYVKCYTLPDVDKYISNCLDTQTISAIYVPYSLDYKLRVFQRLTDIYPGRQVTVVVQSSATALYYQSMLADVHADEFLNGRGKTNVEFVSPAAILEQLTSRSHDKYGVLVLDESNTVNIMYSLLRRVLPYISHFPVYLDACDDESAERTHIISPTVDSIKHVNSTTLVVGHKSSVGISPNMVGCIPIDSYDAVCDTGYRVIPIVEEGTFITTYVRHATAYEKNKTVQWAKSNGYKGVCTTVNNDHMIKQQVGTDSYTKLLWAIEVVTGVTTGDTNIARKLWMTSGFSPTVMDSVALSSLNNMSLSLPLHMSGVTESGAIWNIYQYSNLLYSDFVYEQRHHLGTNRELTMRVGYETRYGRPPICRLVITQTPGETFRTNDYVVAKFLKYYYSVIDKMVVCGFELLADDIPCDRSILSPLDVDDARWVLANKMLPSYRTIELIAVVSLWNSRMCGSIIHTRYSSKLKMFCEYFANC